MVALALTLDLLHFACIVSPSRTAVVYTQKKIQDCCTNYRVVNENEDPTLFTIPVVRRRGIQSTRSVEAVFYYQSFGVSVISDFIDQQTCAINKPHFTQSQCRMGSRKKRWKSDGWMKLEIVFY